ncbi:Ldh family oxidoreductase [Silicimonas algicola]|uniref:LDH2 family malate/lactate/ureidoglycolate dehydrogenase n=1 Tax=Silicimonas algicola TaxID=1826607 RepID=A0A316G5C2_9RHOB|nr:Ldh family oxidoreductase [Silicimonas algicola]AZQ68501.1 Ldh family oxidoreductase [Silicimonas algicola]PWK55792.1 LDH2 family malate/lactate/ureidoglycolate dehydrogenase [Silicimonas algicola]
MPRLPYGEAVELAEAAFRRAGVRADDAGLAASMLAEAEGMGIVTHGLSRVGTYVGRIEAGGIDARAVVPIVSPAPALRRLDGANGLGPVIAERARLAASEAARTCGAGVAVVRRVSHVGALAPLLRRAADDGFAAIVTTNTAPMLAPAGGREARIGNAPIGLAVPDPGGRHLILDMALSTVSRSRIRAAAKAGETIPADWATDEHGRPTTDPSRALTGILRAIGGDKGANLALGLDLMLATLAGAAMLTEIPNAAETPDSPQGLGLMVALIDAERLRPARERAGRLDEARTILSGTARVDEGVPIRLPGDRALARLAEARASGLDLSDECVAMLRRLGG